MKLPVRLINPSNERGLVHGHETIPLRVKGENEYVSSELDNGGQRVHFLNETPRIILLSATKNAAHLSAMDAMRLSIRLWGNTVPLPQEVQSPSLGQ
ncbi:hypothetical protein TNCV_4242961 [Trichonephila clavipes]|nr:hypothetical protein TNCV_4242961 [Trichonephila clavipes]